MKLMSRIISQLSGASEGDQGFTLLELMISLVVFSIGVLGVAVMQTQSVNNHTFSEYVSRNTTAATDQVEELMAADFLDQRTVNEGWGGGPSPDGTMNIEWNNRLTASPNATLVLLTSTYTANNIVSRPNPNINISIIKPFVN